MSLRTLWKARGKLVALVGSWASMAGLLVTFRPSPRDLGWWTVALLVCTTFLLVVFVVLEIRDHRGRRVYAKADTEGIRRYMHDWIDHGGRVAIWTRDMSWAQNRETHELLAKKARDKELILCLPELNELATDLASAGAEVCPYGTTHLESPASRFTIASFGRGGARVAVGRGEGDTHVIDEFSAGGHPAFHLAQDLITLVRSLQGGGLDEGHQAVSQ